MLRKCNYCDPVAKRGSNCKPTKSIDTDLHEFIRDDKGKYYHLDCFKLYLSKRKKVDDSEEIEKIAEQMLKKTVLEMQESIDKDKFLKWIMEFYDGSLPSYFLLKIQKVRTGEHESINEPIPYDVLLDIYKHMERYLRKLAKTKNINTVGQQMNYDLAVVIGNYGDYKKYKKKQQQYVEENKDVDKEIEVTRKVSAIENHENTKRKEDDQFDITEVMGDLLL